MTAKRALVFCLPGIGDALMATPMISLLKKTHPHLEIDIGCMFGGVEYVFRTNPNIARIHRFSLYNESPFKGFKQILNLRNNRYDFSLLAYPAFRREYHIIQRLLGAKQRIAHQFQSGYVSEFNFLNTHLIDVDYEAHNVINNLNLLSALGVTWKHQLKEEHIQYDFVLTKEDQDFGRDFIRALGWQDQTITAVHPGSTASPAGLMKRWPLENYFRLVKHLLEDLGRHVLIFTGPEEVSLGKTILERVKDHRRCHLVDNVKFNEAVGILSGCRLMVTNDNGFGHIAVALGIQTLSLLAPTNYKWSLPYSRGLVSLIKPRDFQPWHRYELKRGVPHNVQSGMDLISLEEVMSKVDQLVASRL